MEYGRQQLLKTNEEIVTYLIGDIAELMEEQRSIDLNDGFYDYLEGIISRSQSILRMMGVPEELIPSDGDC
jgi:phosphoribosylformylglycinamidine (FGAM) synthase-like amidotransferase family enzyme